jgi:hypothetical protein
MRVNSQALRILLFKEKVKKKECRQRTPRRANPRRGGHLSGWQEALFIQKSGHHSGTILRTSC